MKWQAGLLGPALVLASVAGAEDLPAGAAAGLEVLEQFVGTWRVTVRTRRPKPSVVTYTETYAWDLGGHFLRGDSGTKSDGTRDVVYATFDQASRGYPFWIFSSTGAWYYLAPGRWDHGKRTLTWENPPALQINYRSRCEFPDSTTRRCESLVKDWKGSVLLDQEATALRQR